MGKLKDKLKRLEEKTRQEARHIEQNTRHTVTRVAHSIEYDALRGEYNAQLEEGQQELNAIRTTHQLVGAQFTFATLSTPSNLSAEQSTLVAALLAEFSEILRLASEKFSTMQGLRQKVFAHLEEIPPKDAEEQLHDGMYSTRQLLSEMKQLREKANTLTQQLEASFKREATETVIHQDAEDRSQAYQTEILGTMATSEDFSDDDAVIIFNDYTGTRQPQSPDAQANRSRSPSPHR